MDIINLVKKGESQTLEFKINAENVGKDICAFANTNDGTILVGVDDSRNMVGIKNIKRTEEEIANIAHSCDPPIRIKIRKENSLLAVDVKRTSKIHSFKGIVYVRVGSTNKPLSMQEVLELGHKLGKIKFDNQVCEEANLGDIDKEKIKLYLRLREKNRNIPSKIKIPISQFLVNIQAVSKRKPTNAGILFFGKNPLKFISHAQLRLARIKGVKVYGNILDRLDCSGTLWEMVDQAEDFIRKNIRLLGFRTEKFRREDKFDYPIRALREAVINALIHRDYFNPADVRVMILDDRIEVISPGSFPNGVSPEKPEHKPVNKILSNLMYDIGFIEKYGSGIYLENELCLKNGNEKPVYEITPNQTKVIFKSQVKEITVIEIDEGIISQLNKRQKKSLDFLKERGRITTKDYVAINAVSERTARNDLVAMISNGVLQKVGKTRLAYYVIRQTFGKHSAKEEREE